MEKDGKLMELDTVQGRAGSICPLLTTVYYETGDADCCKDMCNWWIHERQCCAIQMLAREAGLHRIGGQDR